MDGDSTKRNKKKNSNGVFNSGDIPQPVGV